MSHDLRYIRRFRRLPGLRPRAGGLATGLFLASLAVSAAAALTSATETADAGQPATAAQVHATR